MRILPISKTPYNNVYKKKPDLNSKSISFSANSCEKQTPYNEKGMIKLAQVLEDDSLLSRYEIEDFLEKALEIPPYQAEEFYRANRDLIAKYFHKDYGLHFEDSQHSTNFDAVFKKKDCDFSKSEHETYKTVRFSPQGITKSIINSQQNTENHQILGGNYVCETIRGLNERWTHLTLLEERRTSGILGGDYNITITKLSPHLSAYDTTAYNLDGIDPKDTVEKIESGELKGVETAKTIKTPDGAEHTEHFEHNGYQTERTYKKSDNGSKTSLDYVITNPNGEKILDLHRTFELKANSSSANSSAKKFKLELDSNMMTFVADNSPNYNTSITTLNGRKYTTEFDDNNMTAVITDDNNERTTIDFGEKIGYQSSNNKDTLWKLIKETPADLLLDFQDICGLRYQQNGGVFDTRKMEIETDSRLATLAHELGHFRDGYDRHITQNPNLIDIYNKEIEELKTKISEDEFETLSYFSQTSLSPAQGLGEIIAEVSLLCNSLSFWENPERDLYLMRYFPRTIAKTAELLGYGVQNENK